jgi:hypothetical protein
MNSFDRTPGDWSPLTCEPGEQWTIEGRIRTVGVVARNLTNNDPRYVAYRRRMTRPLRWVLGSIGAAIAIGSVINAL